MSYVNFACPVGLQADSHYRDAHLWVWVEKQTVCTIDDIHVGRNGTIEIHTAIDVDARTMGALCAAFADNFGS